MRMIFRGDTRLPMHLMLYAFAHLHVNVTHIHMGKCQTGVKSPASILWNSNPGVLEKGIYGTAGEFSGIHNADCT